MESFIKADVFFFITTISLIIVSVILVVALFYILRILRDILHFVKKFREEGESILKDIHNLRENIKAEGENMKSQWQGLLKFISLKSKTGRKARVQKNHNEEHEQ